MENDLNKTAKIRELNDEFRRNMLDGNLGTLVLSAGVSTLNDRDRLVVVAKVYTFNDFNEGNDPYGEHDFGKVELKGESYFWKIDYYNKAMEYHSPDKSDPSVTNRVLTIMQAGEY